MLNLRWRPSRGSILTEGRRRSSLCFHPGGRRPSGGRSIADVEDPMAGSRRRQRAPGPLLLAAMVTSLLAVTAAPMYASHVGCGSLITTDTTLDSDVGPCVGDGLIVAADDITLDLGGHTVSGTGTGAG